MNLLEQLQERYIEEFSNTISLSDFLVSIFITAILVMILRFFYIRFGSAISNRTKFANNFLPLALGTLLIIMIVKSSIALSLGLVGALSIVRFRAAIKDPEELTYLFIAIGLGLAGGANQPVLAVVALSLILLILYVHHLIIGRQSFRTEDKLYVNIQTEEEDLKKVTALLSNIFPHVELKRMDMLAKGMDLSFICKAESVDQIGDLKNQLKALPGANTLSVIDQPNLIL